MGGIFSSQSSATGHTGATGPIGATWPIGSTGTTGPYMPYIQELPLLSLTVKNLQENLKI